MPAELALTIYRGDDFAEYVTFRDEQGVAIDVTARNYTAQVRTQRGAAGTLLATALIDMTQAIAGTVVLRIPATVTATLVGGVWDLVENVNGTRRTLLTGRVVVQENVTR
jgi:hypothetical protein